MGQLKTRSLRLCKSHNYIRIRNKHIFMKVCNWEETLFSQLNFKSDMRIHLFVYNEDDMNECMLAMINHFKEVNEHPRSKFIIHIPKVHEDLVQVLIKKVPFITEKPFKIITEAADVIFYIDANMNILRVRYFGREVEAVIKVGGGKMDVDIKSPLDGVNRRAIDEFKDEIIARFKATTPLGILKSFKDEQDIWEFVNVSGDWKVPEKVNKKKDVIKAEDIFGEEAINKMKEDVMKAVNNNV